MGDQRRFNLFARLINNHFPYVKKVADIAGGQGYLQVALKELGYDVTTYDKRNKIAKFRNLNYKRIFFNDGVKDSYDLLVGMHPDEATDIIITQAIKREIPFVVCPCCILPCAAMFNDNYNFTNWINHLKKLAIKNGYNVDEYHLKMSGKNLVLIGKPSLKKGK